MSDILKKHTKTPQKKLCAAADFEIIVLSADNNICARLYINDESIFIAPAGTNYFIDYGKINTKKYEILWDELEEFAISRIDELRALNISAQIRLQIYIISWFINLFDYMRGAGAHNNQSINDPGSINFYNKLEMLFGKDIITDFVDGILPRQYSHKLILLNYADKVRPNNVDQKPWRELYILNKVRHLGDIYDGFAHLHQYFITDIDADMVDGADKNKLDHSDQIIEITKKLLKSGPNSVGAVAAHLADRYAKKFTQKNDPVEFMQDMIMSGAALILVYDYLGDPLDIFLANAPDFDDRDWDKCIFDLLYNLLGLNTHIKCILGEINCNIQIFPRELAVYVIDGKTYKFGNARYNINIANFAESIIFDGDLLSPRQMVRAHNLIKKHFPNLDTNKINSMGANTLLNYLSALDIYGFANKILAGTAQDKLIYMRDGAKKHIETYCTENFNKKMLSELYTPAEACDTDSAPHLFVMD